MPVPSLAETWIEANGSSPRSRSISSITRSTSADGRSILLMTGTTCSPNSIARYKLATVCASTPCDASTTSNAPSQLISERRTSWEKSTCPGVSIRFSSYVFPSLAAYGSVTVFALIVIPRSRSRSIESRIWSRNSRSSTAPQRWMRRSASVDLPWSMWAMMQKFRMWSIGSLLLRSDRRSHVSVDGEWLACTGRRTGRGRLQPVKIARIGAFELDVEAGELRCSGRLVALTGQPMRILMKLVERAGEVVTREELQREVWGGGTHVDFEAGLATCINQVRTALGDRATSPRFLETLPRRGFRFIAPVEWPAGGRVSGIVQIDRRIAAVAILFVIAAGLAWRVNRSRPAPVPIAVFSVDVDARTPELQPVSLALTDTLIGALVNEAGARARVASPQATRDLEDKPLPAILQGGI